MNQLKTSVMDELVALHRANEGKGATCREIHGALTLRRMHVGIEDVGQAIELLLVDSAIQEPNCNDDAPSNRDGWPVWVPPRHVA